MGGNQGDLRQHERHRTVANGGDLDGQPDVTAMEAR